MQEYTVRIKDLNQDIIHNIKQLAPSQREANLAALDELKKLFNHNDFELL